MEALHQKDYHKLVKNELPVTLRNENILGLVPLATRYLPQKRPLLRHSSTFSAAASTEAKKGLKVISGPPWIHHFVAHCG